jgi:hypothetical protein
MDAAYISFLPMTMTGGIWPVSVNGGEPEIRAGNDTASLRFVTPGLFAVVWISLRSGRDVSESDTLEGPPVAVVSESTAIGRVTTRSAAISDSPLRIARSSAW